MRVVLHTEGTLGDHYPFLALALALKERGHDPLLAINSAMLERARAAGLDAMVLTDKERGPQEARENAWAWDHWNNPKPEAHPKATRFDPDLFLTQVRELLAAARGADLLLSTAIRPHGYLVQAALGLPRVTVSVNPSTFAAPVSAVTAAAAREAGLKEHANLRDAFAYVAVRLGISHDVPPWSRGWRLGRHVVLGSSRWFSDVDVAGWRPQCDIHQTGFWLYDDPGWTAWQPDSGLAAFVDRQPLVLTFSSQPLERPAEVLARHVEAAARLERPLLVLRGWAGFDERDLPSGTDAEQVRFADAIPHDWIFARAAAAIVHGGIGSIARAVRHGCPLLVEPFGNDQFFNALRVAQIGVGDTAHPFKTSAATLAEKLATGVLTPGCRRKCEKLGARIGAERGLDEACRIIESCAAAERGRRTSVTVVPPWTAAPAPAAVAAAPADGTNGPPGPWLLPRARSARADSKGHNPMIPRILHQTWKDTALPPDLAALRDTWLAAHPNWTVHLWTDVDNREFLARHYPWFLRVYDQYPEHIMRVDAVRYFLLYHFGGVYADLDVESLRPLDPLLQGRQVVLGEEPPSHALDADVLARSLDHIVCNAIMASVPGHPFWEHVIRQLVLFHREPGTMDATGPFLLTRAYDSYPDRDAITLESAARLYPVDHADLESDDLPGVRARVAGSAYTIHWWRGGWWRDQTAQQAMQVRASLLVEGQLLATTSLAMDRTLAYLYQQAPLPMVSCLMVTKDRPALARHAVACFQRQTYPNRELIIVDDGASDTLDAWVRDLADPQIRHLRLPADDRPLGELRNAAVAAATGEYVAGWDDDDLSHPNRLALQVAAARALRADACFLERELMWWPRERRIAASCRRVWEGSMLCTRAGMPAYPAERRGEDTPVAFDVARRGRTVLLDAPFLYVYIFHGANTFEAAHWNTHWRAATEQYEGAAYDTLLAQLQQALGIDFRAWEKATSPVVSVAAVRPPDEPPVRTAADPPDVEPAGDEPSILILTPVKNAVRALPHYVENLKALTYPHGLLSIALLESDSSDGTFEWLSGQLDGLRREFARVELFKRDYAYALPGHRADASEQLRRRGILARSRNYLLTRALRDETWVLWIDADVCRWPRDVIQQLLAVRKDIVVPNCLVEGTDRTFDYGTFRLKPDADDLDWTPYLVDGLILSPPGFGRFYLSDLRGFDCVSVDSVGGTMLLVRADLHREGLTFPAVPYRRYIETEGLAALAKDMGHRCWGLPKLEIFHPADIPRAV